MPEQVWIVDSSALIELKDSLPAREQWAFFKCLETLVEAGKIRFPIQVVRELSRYARTDVAGGWAVGVEAKLHPPREPTFEAVEAVMTAAPKLVEDDAEDDPADPYVVALALELRNGGSDAVVVTDDVRDRLPLKEAMKSACARLKIPVLSSAEFVKVARNEAAALEAAESVRNMVPTPAPLSQMSLGLSDEDGGSVPGESE
jgi:rRNA maturation endonuclease Nob1